MGKKRAGERESQEQAKAAAGTPGQKKRRSGSPTTTDGAAVLLCDDVVGNILARAPARTAVASTALSKQHLRLIRSPEFRLLHRRLAPPLPRPHVAYLVTSTVTPRPAGNDEVPASVFHGFHVAAGAGAGGFNGNAPPAPMRSLAGRRFSDVGYVNTCNGIVLLAGDKYSACRSRCTCILWNPAVADAAEEVSVPDADADADASTTDEKEYRALGLGFGQRSETYKLVLLCRAAAPARRGLYHDGTENHSLVTYVLGDPGKQQQPTRMTELPAVRGDAEISQHSLYMDGKIYLLLSHGATQGYPAAVLAFDVDDETVTSIDLPSVVHDPDGGHGWNNVSGLMEVSGRPCVLTDYGGVGGGCALWLLSVDHQWHRRCLIGDLRSEACILPYSIVGVWDCGGVLVLCYEEEIDDPDRLFLYDIAAGKMFRANLGGVVALECCSEPSGLAFCWGYRPTLEAPSSVVGKQLRQDEDRRCRECSTSSYVMKALKPVAEQDRRKGQEATLNTVCFMDFLVRIMQKLPKDLQQVLEMKTVDSDDPDFSFENVLFQENI